MTVKYTLPKLLLFVMLGSLASLITLLNTTNPASAGAIGILGVFIFSYAFAVSTLSFFLYGVSRIIAKTSRLFTARKPIAGMPLKHAYYYSSVIGLAPVLMLGMQSVGSLGAYEIGLVVLFLLIGCIYVSKRAA